MSRCNACRIQTSRTGKPVNCDGCPQKCPDVLPNNHPALELWGLVSTQWRSSGFGLVGLDYLALIKVADIYGIDVDDRLFDKMRIMEREVLREQKDDMERDKVKNGSR